MSTLTSADGHLDSVEDTISGHSGQPRIEVRQGKVVLEKQAILGVSKCFSTFKNRFNGSSWLF